MRSHGSTEAWRSSTARTVGTHGGYSGSSYSLSSTADRSYTGDKAYVSRRTPVSERWYYVYPGEEGNSSQALTERQYSARGQATSTPTYFHSSNRVPVSARLPDSRTTYESRPYSYKGPARAQDEEEEEEYEEEEDEEYEEDEEEEEEELRGDYKDYDPAAYRPRAEVNLDRKPAAVASPAKSSPSSPGTAALRDQIKQLNNQVASLKGERDALQDTVEEMTEAARMSKNRTPQKDASVQRELDAARDEIERLKANQGDTQVRELESDIKALKAELKSAKSQLKASEAEVLSLQDEKERYAGQRSQMEGDFDRELREAENEIASLQTAKDQLLAERDQLEDALHQAQADFDELSQQFNMLSLTAPQAAAAVQSQHSLSQQQMEARLPPHQESPIKAPAAAPAAPSSPTRNLGTGAVRGKGVYSPNAKEGAPWGQSSGGKTGPVPVSSSSNALLRDTGLDVEVMRNVPDPEDGVLLCKCVVDGSPAQKAGIRTGDLIEKWNRRVILSGEEYATALENTQRGTLLRLGLLRNGVRKQAIITLPP